MAAGEGRRHEEIAGEEDGEGDCQPFDADEDYGVDLIFVAVSYLLQKFFSLHINDMRMIYLVSCY